MNDTFALDLAAKATIILGVAGVTATLLRRAPAAARHLVWALGLGGLLRLPVAAAVLPPLPGWWTLSLAPAAAADPQPSTPMGSAITTSSVSAVSAVSSVSSASSVPSVPSVPSASSVVSVPSVLSVPSVFQVWAIGAALLLVSLGVALWRIARLRRRAWRETGPAWQALVAQVSAEVGLRRDVTLLRIAGPAMPMTWGARRPVVLLPQEADQWPDARRRDVLRHELAHVRRGDWLTQLLARVVCALYWFHPLAWVAAHALRVERERACDDQVLRAGALPSAYAAHLLEIASGFRARASVAGVAMARPSHLATRLLDVLDPRRRRNVVTSRQAGVASAVAVALVLPLAAAAPAAREVALPFVAAVIDANPPAPFDVVPAVDRMATPAAPAPQADTLAECAGATRRSSHSSETNGAIIVSATIGSCTLKFMADHDVEFTDDYTDIASVPAGGAVTLETNAGGVRRELQVRNRNGTLERTYRVNGDEKPYDADARRWVAGALTLMFRTTGVAAKERAGAILRSKGVQGLLTEMEELGGDYTRRQYAQVALASDQLDVPGTERLITWAGKSIASDYELAELLSTAARKPMPPRTQAAFITAARTLESDYEQARTLSVALARSDLDPAAAGAMLDAAQDLDSDYELAQLLIKWQRGRAIAEPARPAFFRAVNSLGSDYEQRRVLSAAVGRGEASAAVVADALAAAKSLDSDYELAELLTAVAELYPLTQALRPAFFGAVGTISSSHEQGRVLQAVAQRPDLPAEVIEDVLRSASTVGSDYEHAQVLVVVAERQKLTEALRKSYVDATRGLSGYEYQRAMAALGKTFGRQPI